MGYTQTFVNQTIATHIEHRADGRVTRFYSTKLRHDLVFGMIARVRLIVESLALLDGHKGEFLYGVQRLVGEETGFVAAVEKSEVGDLRGEA